MAEDQNKINNKEVNEIVETLLKKVIDYCEEIEKMMF